MRWLALAEAVLALEILFGPTVNDANRVTGLASVGVSALLTIAMVLSARTRWGLGAWCVVLVIGIAALVPHVDVRLFHPPWSDLAALLPLRDDWSFLPVHVLGIAAVPAVLAAMSFVIAEETPHRARPIWGLVAVSTFAVALMSGSRTAWIAIGAGSVVLCAAILLRDRRGLIFICACLTLAVTFLAGGRADDPGFAGRIGVWRFVVESPAQSLLLGRFGGFPYFYAVSPDALDDPATNTHNLLIQLLSDFGLVGVAVIAISVAVALRAAFAAEPRSAVRLASVACVVGLIAAGGAESIIDVTVASNGQYLDFVSPQLLLVLAMSLGANTFTPVRRKAILEEIEAAPGP